MYCSFLLCIVVSCLVCIVVSFLVYIVVVYLCVLLSSYVYLLHYVCIAVFTLDAQLRPLACWGYCLETPRACMSASC